MTGNSMNIDSFLYEKELSGRIDSSDREYILSCVSFLHTEAEGLKREAEKILLEFCELFDSIEKERDRYSRGAGSILGAVKKYNDTLTGDGIWSTVRDDADKKRMLRDFYSHTSLIGRCAPDLSISLQSEKAEKIKEDILHIGRRIRLCGIAAEFALREDADLYAADKIIKETEEKADSLITSIAKSYLTLEKNEILLSGYLASLGDAIDAENKGEKMNISSARRCNNLFSESFKTSL